MTTAETITKPKTKTHALAAAPSYAAGQEFDWGDRKSEIDLHNYYSARPYWGF